MTPAELRTAHDALGCPAAVIAERAGVHVNNVGRYEHMSRKRDVPEATAQAIATLQEDFGAAVVLLADAADELGFVPRHRDLEEFYEMCPTVRGWGRTTQGLVCAMASTEAERGVIWA